MDDIMQIFRQLSRGDSEKTSITYRLSRDGLAEKLEAALKQLKWKYNSGLESDPEWKKLLKDLPPRYQGVLDEVKEKAGLGRLFAVGDEDEIFGKKLTIVFEPTGEDYLVTFAISAYAPEIIQNSTINSLSEVVGKSPENL